MTDIPPPKPTTSGRLARAAKHIEAQTRGETPAPSAPPTDKPPRGSAFTAAELDLLATMLRRTLNAAQRRYLAGELTR